MAGYVGGRIKRIKIHNFMTYDEVDIIPKDGLNFILGLNGSGKSSIMCAICLGLAGKPQFTGRTSSLSDFVKHGQQEAEIEIELESTQGRNVVITRKIKGDKSEWYLNKRPSNVSEVTGAVKTFNIDTSNLCQFLPQEKVVEFSRMDKRQRLENMIQSIGEPQLFELFNDLKSMYKKCGEIEKNLKKSEEKKNSAEEKNDQISDEVQKQENRVRLKKELEDTFKLRFIFRYQESKDEVGLLKKDRESAKNELNLLIKEQNKALTVENAIYSEYKEQAEKLHRAKSDLQDLTTELNGKSNMVSSLNEQVDNANIEFKNKMAEKESQKERLKDISIQIEDLERLLEELKKKQNMEEQTASNGQALSQLQVEMAELYQNVVNASTERNAVSYETQSCKNKLVELKDEQNKKLSNLKKYDIYTYDAVLWLNENSGQFKSRIYLPILEISVHSQEYCKYIENHIPSKAMFAFVCEDKEDCRRFIDIFKNQKKLPVNIVMVPDEPLSYFKSPALPQEFKNWGLDCFLIDVFTAPEPVMRYLCSCYCVHKIPVATSAIDNYKVDVILQTFRVFYSDEIKISCKQSLYGDQNWSSRKDFIINCNLLVNFDDSAFQELERRIQILQEHSYKKNIAYEKLKTEFAEKEKIQEKLQQERKNLEDSRKQIQTISTNLSMKRNYRKEMSVVINQETEKAKVVGKVQSINAQKEKLFFDISKLFKDIYILQKEIIKLMLCMNSLSKEYKLAKAGNTEIHDKVKEKEKTFNELKTIVAEKKAPAAELAREIGAMKINPFLLNRQTTLEETEAKISHLQAQLNFNDDNEPLIKLYNDRKQKITVFEADINQLQTTLSDLKSCIDEKKQAWLNSLQYHITNINKKFSGYFKHLCCAGEITLDIPEDPNDFANYGLQIKLKFRDDQPMTELSQSHHSGGECSVAAIVFILSLQELTEVPFRCIDEINQGMDSIYERKIYQLVADSVRDDRCSQYFLLSPKPLMNFKFPDGVAVHIIYNSSYLNFKLDIKNLLEVAQST